MQSGDGSGDLCFCVVSLLASRAQASPAAPAVVCGQHSITYAEFGVRSTALARYLRSMGATRGSIVGLLTSRSIAHAVGAAGIMKAGAAYLPLQPGDPARRVEFQLEDAGAELIVTAEGWAASLGDTSRRIVSLAPDGSLIEKGQKHPEFVADVKVDDLAYVIYTSGSTGEPKGVEITHGNLLNLIQWHCREFAVTAADRASQISSVGVDAAVWELWPYLAAGASVHVAEDTVVKDPQALRDWLVAKKITISFVPTPMAERLMELRWPSNASLRRLLTGGDILRSYPSPEVPFEVVNNYGPTECTVVATSAAVATHGSRPPLPPIGRPIANTQLHILDEEMRPVATGEAGEIWISGTGVGRGYRNRSGLTSERFGTNPFSSKDGNRIYRTGDRGRVLADGQISFLGRVDNQIKIRGFRIEPGEIEAALNEHSAVQQSAVTCLETVSGEKRLVAHVVVQAASAISSSELQRFVGERLPEHMIPTAFVRLARMPLLPSGKIDRGGLASPGPHNALLECSQRAARTVTERRLQEMVSLALKVDRVGMEDNFFMLGGHSLLAAQLMARVRDAFGVEIGLRFLFEFPTISAVAKEIERILCLRVQAMTDEEAQCFLDNDLSEAREGA
jgi:amino acid adenylation domain-containing protein